MAFTYRHIVRFDEVDFARVVYFPRLLGYCHQAFETFFGERLKIPYAKMLTERGIGFPIVHVEADFKSPFRFGDTCRIEMDFPSIGKRSLTHAHKLYSGDSATIKAQVEIVTATVATDGFAPIELPVELRNALAEAI